MPWGWIFARIIEDGRSTKVAKGIVVRWHLTFQRFCFPMHLYEPHTFEWKNCWEFQTTSPPKPLSQFYSNFIWSYLRSGERKIVKMVAVHWPRWPPCPYMVKNFENLLLQNRGCLGAEFMLKSSTTGDLPKLLKRLSYVDIWPFYGKVKFASLCICMSPITFVCENCLEFQTTSPLKPRSQICSIFYSPEYEVLLVSYCGQ